MCGKEAWKFSARLSRNKVWNSWVSKPSYKTEIRIMMTRPIIFLEKIIFAFVEFLTHFLLYSSLHFLMLNKLLCYFGVGNSEILSLLYFYELIARAVGYFRSIGFFNGNWRRQKFPSLTQNAMVKFFWRR